MVDYEFRATAYAEKYGIVEYKVKKNRMIYYSNARNREYNGKKWVDHPCTYKRTVDLDAMKCIENVRLKRLQKDGWKNS